MQHTLPNFFFTSVLAPSYKKKKKHYLPSVALKWGKCVLLRAPPPTPSILITYCMRKLKSKIHTNIWHQSSLSSIQDPNSFAKGFRKLWMSNFFQIKSCLTRAYSSLRIPQGSRAEKKKSTGFVCPTSKLTILSIKGCFTVIHTRIEDSNKPLWFLPLRYLFNACILNGKGWHLLSRLNWLNWSLKGAKHASYLPSLCSKKCWQCHLHLLLAIFKDASLKFWTAYNPTDTGV